MSSGGSASRVATPRIQSVRTDNYHALVALLLEWAALRRLTFDMRGGRQLAKPDVGRPLDGRVRRRLPPRYYARAAVTTISIFHSGRASCACTVALDG